MRVTFFFACLTFFCLSALSLPAFGQTERPRFEELARQFDYDRAASLDVRETGRQGRDGVTVVDLSYASPRGGRVPAYLVVPKGRGPVRRRPLRPLDVARLAPQEPRPVPRRGGHARAHP